jgi:hypothetical protein
MSAPDPDKVQQFVIAAQRRLMQIKKNASKLVKNNTPELTNKTVLQMNPRSTDFIKLYLSNVSLDLEENVLEASGTSYINTFNERFPSGVLSYSGWRSFGESVLPKYMWQNLEQMFRLMMCLASSNPNQIYCMARSSTGDGNKTMAKREQANAIKSFADLDNIGELQHFIENIGRKDIVWLGFKVVIALLYAVRNTRSVILLPHVYALTKCIYAEDSFFWELIRSAKNVEVVVGCDKRWVQSLPALPLSLVKEKDPDVFHMAFQVASLKSVRAGESASRATRDSLAARNKEAKRKRDDGNDDSTIFYEKKDGTLMWRETTVPPKYKTLNGKLYGIVTLIEGKQGEPPKVVTYKVMVRKSDLVVPAHSSWCVLDSQPYVPDASALLAELRLDSPIKFI